ncbi:hypothetical protein EI94DRAFT_1835423 [Lactarius quietus]|nr:hypothetical protein EI94DRAFT_1835423 [Lactarius quietus]
MAPLWYLSQATEKLLKDIYTGEYQRDSIRESWDDTLPDLKNKALNFSKDISPSYLQDLCVARIFRCFCLLLVGENFDTLRDNVVQVASSLQRIPPPESSTFHGRYIDPRHWTQLAEALYHSATSPFDNLVRLRLESSLTSSPQIMGVDLVTFRETRAIPNLLRSHPGNDAITTNVSHENTGGPHVATAGQVTDGIDEADELTGYQLVEKAVEYSADDAVDMGDGEGPDRSREAIVIQRAVRRYLLKFSEGSSKDEMKTRRDRLFKLCSASANAVHARYRKIYLGPVPHLLLCLDWIILSAQAEKVTIKARRKDATLPSQALSDLSTLTDADNSHP